MTHADYHPCAEGCGRDSELPGPCEECDMRRRLPPMPPLPPASRRPVCNDDLLAMSRERQRAERCRKLAQDILGGRAAVLLALLDGPARATSLHDRIRGRAGTLVVVTDGACRKAMACLERDGLIAECVLVGTRVGFELTTAGRLEAEGLRAACLALARPMQAVKIVAPRESKTA